MNKFKQKSKLEIAVYIIIGLLGIIALIFPYINKKYSVLDILLNLGTELIGGAMIFFVLRYFIFSIDDSEQTIQSNINKLQEDFSEKNKEISNNFSEILKLLQSNTNFEIIKGSNTISKKASSCIIEADKIIKGTDFSKNSYQGPTDFEKKLKDLLIQRTEEDNPITYKMIYSKSQNFQQRKFFFTDNNIQSESIKFHHWKNPIPIQVLIIDDKYLFLAIPEQEVDKFAKTCIFIKNNNDLIKSFSDWYDEFLWKKINNE